MRVLPGPHRARHVVCAYCCASAHTLDLPCFRASHNHVHVAANAWLLKVKVPEPKAYNKAQNTKELENFQWDMEQYF